jgi:sortase A
VQWVLRLATLGLLGLVGAALYQEVWTNYAAHVRTAHVREQLVRNWREGEVVVHSVHTSGSRTHNGIHEADAFALLYIPRLVDQVWETPVLQGVNPPQLDSGVGHYIGTAQPGEPGNFALAGHRATYGEPFAYFDRLRSGDRVYVRTFGRWFVYVLDNDMKIKPRDVWVIDPRPGQLARSVPSDHLISLVTCDPRWGSVRRWVWWGHLVATHPKDEPPLEVRKLQAIR